MYPRPSYDFDLKHNHIHIVNDVPQMEISSSFIRSSIKQRRNVIFGS